MTIASKLKSLRPYEIMLGVLLPLAAPAALGQCYGLRPIGPNAPPPPPPGTPCSKAKATAPAPPKGANPTPGQPPISTTGPDSPQLPGSKDPNGPTVFILWTDHNNQNIANSTQTIVAGEPVHVRAQCSTPGSGRIAFKWAAAANLSGGFEDKPKPGKTPGTEVPGGYQPFVDDTQSTTVFGVFSGTHPILRLVCQDAQGRKNSADVHFDVDGPALQQSGVQPKIGQAPMITVSPSIGKVDIYRAVDPKTKVLTTYLGPRLHTLLQIQNGLQIKATPQGDVADQGHIEWMQVITKDVHTSPLLKGGDASFVEPPYLDGGAVPYPDDIPDPSGNRLLHQDEPSIPLYPIYSAEGREFRATAYLLFLSGAAGSIPVPVASINWNWSGSAHPDPKARETYGWDYDPGLQTHIDGSANPIQSLRDLPCWNTAGTNNCVRSQRVAPR